VQPDSAPALDVGTNREEADVATGHVAEGVLGTENFAAKAVQSGVGLHEMKRQVEVEMVRFALVQCDGNITRAARMLDMRRPRLSQIVNGSPELESLRGRLSGRDEEADEGGDDLE
jgi:DNA-binding NtrC family response regulator